MRRHDTDVTSLVFGLIFVGLAGVWALVQGDVLAFPDVSVVGPALLVLAGVVGLAATLSGSARSRRRAQQVADWQEGRWDPRQEEPEQPAAQPADPSR